MVISACLLVLAVQLGILHWQMAGMREAYKAKRWLFRQVVEQSRINADTQREISRIQFELCRLLPPAELYEGVDSVAFDCVMSKEPIL